MKQEEKDFQENGKRYLVVFRLSSDLLKQYYRSINIKQSWDDISRFMKSNGFEHLKDTTYISKAAMSEPKFFKTISSLVSKYPWLYLSNDVFKCYSVDKEFSFADIVKGKENEDPSSVIFAACDKAKNENYDVLICDTAGRLQNKKYLMDEVEKMKRVIDRELPEASKETMLVLDGSTGQNAISQVNSFSECTGITGLIVTKLDGTAKGGVIIRLVKENQIPIKFIGVGEKIDDMEEFNSEEFINAIIS